MSNRHIILSPAETVQVATCPAYPRWVVDDVPIFCKDRIYASGITLPGSKKLHMVVGRVFQPDEVIPVFLPPNPPTAKYVRAKINIARNYYEFGLYANGGILVDARVPIAAVGPHNVLVTWARFGLNPFWIRCDREREFNGVPPP
jgi:hypothetical protein